VDGGEQAVLFDRVKGVLPETTAEGTHFLVPWLQKAVIFDVRTRPRSISSVTGTKGASAGWPAAAVSRPRARARRATRTDVRAAVARAGVARRRSRGVTSHECPTR
jgi:regulator of protease activity HflC (stomatin/prohibitin superfamily)